MNRSSRGKKLKPAENKQRERSLVNRALRNLIMWVLICGMLIGIVVGIDYAIWVNSPAAEPYVITKPEPAHDITPEEIRGERYAGGDESLTTITVYPEYQIPYGLPSVIPWIFAIGFYVAVIDVIYLHAKRQRRNVVRWITAFIVFSPLLAGIAYLLTWPKSQQ